MNLAELRADLDTLIQDPTLFEAAKLMARNEALDFIQFINQFVDLRRHQGQTGALLHLKETANQFKLQLQAADGQLFEQQRTFLQSPQATPTKIRALFDQYTAYHPAIEDHTHVGYDGLDILVQGIFQLDSQPKNFKLPEADMVHFEPTPGRVILELLDKVPLTRSDTFFDLGSGLGNVALMVRLLSPSQVIGVEFEAAYCAFARTLVTQFNCADIQFQQVDARTADYATGTHFFMFTPFSGQLLQAVLDRLAFEAKKRPITLCTYGTCTFTVIEQPWLKLTNPEANHAYKLAIFKSQPT